MILDTPFYSTYIQSVNCTRVHYIRVYEECEKHTRCEAEVIQIINKV